MPRKDGDVVQLTVKEKGSKDPPSEPYEPPKLTKFEKLEKLIVSGE